MDYTDYLNKTALIGTSWVNANDEVVERRQMYGTIKRIDNKGIAVA
ncbi:MAG: hypothetical protein J4G05_09625 [Chlorobi bacterium]|nr:hypothetical protein [Chlorobiota bacterium]